MNKFNFDEIAKAINYSDYQYTFHKGDGSKIDFDELFERGIDEDDFPRTIEDFKKLGYGFSREVFECNDNDDREVQFEFDDENDLITISSENFSAKECFIIIDMIRKHLQVNIDRELFVCFGNNDEETHTLYHGESTAYGMWWGAFLDLFTSRLDVDDRMKRVFICIEDYQTNDTRYYTKDRVIHIILD